MERCKEAFMRKIKERPFYKLMLTSVMENSFVQTLIFVTLGIIILFFAKGENKEIINTVGVTIITASLFKFLLSANAFTKVISDVIKESFLDMEFVKSYNNEKLFDVLDNVSSEILDRNYKDLKESIKAEIFNILGEQNGYYKSLTLEYSDVIITDKQLTETTNISTIVNVSRYDETYKSKTTYEVIPNVNFEEHFKLIYAKIDDKIVENVKVKHVEFKKNGTDFVSFIYEFPLNKGESKIEIKSKALDSTTEHAFFMKKTCANVKVIFKFDNNIIEPTIISKYGEAELEKSTYSSNALVEGYGNKPFFQSEFLFIKYKRKIQC